MKTPKLHIKKLRQSGFTLVELVMATGVFSVVLLIGLTAFVQIGRAYYKGVTITQTRDTANSILSEVSANIRLSSSVSTLGSASGGRYYYCVGSHRYSFMPFNMVSSASNTSDNFGILEDTLPGNSGCGNPFDSPSIPLVNPVELLGHQMRVLSFDINPAIGNSNLYTLDIKIAYGVDSVLTDTASSDATCSSDYSSSQFCAITDLNTVIYEGI